MNNSSIKKWLKYGVLVATPAFSYLIFEMITGNLLSIRGIFSLWNLLFFYSFYFILFAITNSVRLSYILLNIIFTFWSIAEFYVVRFRERPIMFWDIMAWKTAMTVADNYSYRLSFQILAAILMMVLLCIMASLFSYKINNKKRRIISLAGTFLSVGIWFTVFYNILIPVTHLDVNMWNPKESYEIQGYLLCTMRIFDYLRVKTPVDYSEGSLRSIEEHISAGIPLQQAGTGMKEQVKPTNIICIMNESWSDLSVVAPFEVSSEYLSFYQSLSENCVKGNIVVPVFGSMTSNSEYEFLTGNSMAFAPEGSVPYQIYMRKPTYSLPMILKEQGYKTVAMHPYPGQNWNRVEAYRDMGFDEFLDEQFFLDSPRIRGYVSDQGNYDKIIRLTSQKEDGEPLFIFNVTMQNHGGYDQDYDGDIELREAGKYPLAEQYLSLIKESDDALEYLIRYYQNLNEPTLIMMFGDHQPSIEEAFYEELYGAELSSLKPEDYLRRYMTPFFVWTNYETVSQQVDHLSVLYLSNLVIQQANLEMTKYQYFLEELSHVAPVIHMLGYYNGADEWNSWTNWREKNEYPVLHQLELLQYHAMFDKKRIMSHLFTKVVRE